MRNIKIVGLSGLLTLVGCFDVGVGPDIPLACVDDNGCPAGLVCNAFTARCVAPTTLDDRAPGLVGAAVITPTSGVHGDVFSVRFDLDGDVLGDPRVVADVGGREVAFTLDAGATDRVARAWAFTLQPDTSVPTGEHTIRLGFIAPSGVPVAPIVLGTITVQAPAPAPAPAPPGLVGDAVVSPALGDATTAFSASFTLDRDVAARPEVTIDLPAGARAFVVDDDGSDPSARRWRFTLSADSGIPDGVYTVRARVRASGAPVGIAEAVIELGRFTLDTTGPIASIVLEPALVGRGGRARLSVVPTEPLAETPTLVFADGVDPGFELVTETPSLLVWELTLQCLELGCLPRDGRYRILGIDVRDAAGNARRLVPPDLAVVVDSSPPRIVSLALTTTRLSEVPGFDAIGCSFVVDEAVRLDAVTVALDDLELDCSSAPAGAGTRYTCEGTVDEGLVQEGDRVVSVAVIDDAGNAAAAAAPVIVDFTPPVIVPGSALLERQAAPGSLPIAGSTAITPGTTITVSFTADEALAGSPVVEAVPAGTPPDLPGLGAIPLPALELLGQRLARHRQVLTSSVAGGDYIVRATFADVVGHETSTLIGLDFRFARVVESPCPAAACVDVDGDGQVGFSPTCLVGIDCDDSNPSVFVGAPEFPGDGLDNDCGDDGDAPVDESVGLFVDPLAPPNGDGTRLAPLRGLVSRTQPTVFFLAKRDQSVGGVVDGNTTVVGGFDPVTWTREAGDRTPVDFISGPNLFLQGVITSNSVGQSPGTNRVVVIDSEVVGFMFGLSVTLVGVSGRPDSALDELNFVGQLLAIDSDLGGLANRGGQRATLVRTSTTIVANGSAELRVISSVASTLLGFGRLIVVGSTIGPEQPGFNPISYGNDVTIENSLVVAGPSGAFTSTPRSIRNSAFKTLFPFNPADFGVPPEYEGNFSVDDPGLIDGVHILPDSALVNRGGPLLNDPLGQATTDIDGACRIGVADVGADEAG